MNKAHWSSAHTLALVFVVAGFIGMALWRPWGMFTSWIAAMLAMTAFILVAGHGIKGVWFGALIDERNKMSLSRLQMATWTILVLAAYGTIAIARVSENPDTALAVVIPPTLWLLMGISTTSLVGSPLIKSTHKDPTRSVSPNRQNDLLQSQGVSPDAVHVEGSIVYNRNAREASFSDFFTGEEVANVTHLDLAKIQMFFFTVLIVLAYGVSVGSLLGSASIPDSLPGLGEGTLALLGISHTGYLANKAVPLTRG